jgi:hypothetical protein
MNEWVGEDRSTRRKTCLRFSFWAKDATCIALGLNLGYCGDSLAHNRLNNDTAFIKKVIGRSFGVLILGTGILSCFALEVSPTVFPAIIDYLVCLCTKHLQSIWCVYTLNTCSPFGVSMY